MSIGNKIPWAALFVIVCAPGTRAADPSPLDDLPAYIAFQYARRGDRAGVGRGIFILDLQARAAE